MFKLNLKKKEKKEKKEKFNFFPNRLFEMEMQTLNYFFLKSPKFYIEHPLLFNFIIKTPNTKMNKRKKNKEHREKSWKNK